jgi:branched-chain amino acid transport system substrate-binding protein
MGWTWFARGLRAGLGVLTVAAMSLLGLGSTVSTAQASGSGIPSGPVAVGGIYDLSGPYGVYGLTELKGTQGLIQYFNKHGGIEGHNLKLTYMNDQEDVTTAASDAQQLIGDGVKLIVSSGDELTSPATVPLFMRAHIPVIFYDPGDNWGNAKKYPYYYKTGFGTYADSVAMADWAKHLHVTKIGLASDNENFGIDSSNDFLKAAKAAGLDVVKQVYYPSSAVSLSTQMEQLRSAGAEGVYITGAGGYNQAFAAMQSMGWTPTILAFGSILAFPQMAGLLNTPQAAKAYTICDGYCLPRPGSTLPASYSALTKFVESVSGPNQNPGVSEIYGNDDLEIFKYAVEKAHTLNGPAVKRVLDTIHGKSFTMPGITYTYSSTNHNGLDFPEPIVKVSYGWGPQMNPYLAPGSSWPAAVPT